ncbi:hypothetical protein J2Z21_001561 [Streptomyces griseochromogenes]|uniref:Uncharacterized protein n=1 Tax=Streptomyces griseochromogenes TaxID=68214 RepID=A0A1B1B7L9_9ACTN|nr:hypothetical protein [Streptomyces griseochromogenes]ANP54793.1 hypothetical protein AVL59_39015 [Streptomyces griseochromogenes]MBP2048636.1 hypothetical protein [Streptomyces griseochromogenes]
MMETLRDRKDADPRPRPAVVVLGGVMRVRERRWTAGDGFGLEAIRALTASRLDQVGSALMGNWRAE